MLARIVRSKERRAFSREIFQWFAIFGLIFAMGCVGATDTDAEPSTKEESTDTETTDETVKTSNSKDEGVTSTEAPAATQEPPEQSKKVKVIFKRPRGSIRLAQDNSSNIVVLGGKSIEKWHEKNAKRRTGVK